MLKITPAIIITPKTMKATCLLRRRYAMIHAMPLSPLAENTRHIIFDSSHALTPYGFFVADT